MGVASRHSLRRVYLMTQDTLYLASSGSSKILCSQLIQARHPGSAPKPEMPINYQHRGRLAVSCLSLLVVNQLQGHGLSIGVDTRRGGGHGFAVAGDHDTSAGVIFGF